MSNDQFILVAFLSLSFSQADFQTAHILESALNQPDSGLPPLTIKNALCLIICALALQLLGAEVELDVTRVILHFRTRILLRLRIYPFLD